MPSAEYDVSRFNNQYELTWLAPADNGEPIDMYQIKYCQIKRVSGEWEVLENTCRTEDIKTQGRLKHWIKNLYSDTFYKVELKAHNIMGFSKPGSGKFKTARGKFLSFNSPFFFSIFSLHFFSYTVFNHTVARQSIRILARTFCEWMFNLSETKPISVTFRLLFDLSHKNAINILILKKLNSFIRRRLMI